MTFCIKDDFVICLRKILIRGRNRPFYLLLFAFLENGPSCFTNLCGLTYSPTAILVGVLGYWLDR